MKKFRLLLCCLVMGIHSCKSSSIDNPAPAPADTTGGKLSYIYEAGSHGYSCFRIPAIIKTKKGVLLAFAEARKNNCKDEGDIDLVLKRSADNGKTWSEPVMVWDDGDNTCGNPLPVLDEQSGKIVLLMTWNLGEDAIGDINAGTSKDTRRAFVTSSTDEGLTWATPREITADVKKPGWGWYATGPCHGIQLRQGAHAGRLVIPSNYISVRNGDNPARDSAHIIYSDDHGATWRLGGIVPRVRAGESTAAELSDGRLMLNIRNGEGGARIVATSSDAGASWQEAHTDYTLAEPVCQGSLLGYTNGNEHTLFFSNPASNKRENMTIRMSKDDGRSWSKIYKVYAGPSAYSDIVMLGDGRIGILYEGGTAKPYEGIAFKAVPLNDFR
jgi:sialidase-1